MKKIISAVAIAFWLVSVSFPLQAMAYGGYYVIKGEKKYHFVSCVEVMGNRLEDLKYYETKSQVEKAKFKPANCCTEDSFDYESDGATVWFSSDSKIQNALEMERLFGIFDGYDVGLEEGKVAGYEAGHEVGFEAGYDNGYSEGYAEAKNELEEKYKKENKTSKILLIVVAVIFGLPVISTISEIFWNIVDIFKKKS